MYLTYSVTSLTMPGQKNGDGRQMR